jgi:hypothetical protein
MSAVQWSNYEYQPSFILGFHGCDKSVGENIISGKSQHLSVSLNSIAPVVAEL